MLVRVAPKRGSEGCAKQSAEARIGPQSFRIAAVRSYPAANSAANRASDHAAQDHMVMIGKFHSNFDDVVAQESALRCKSSAFQAAGKLRVRNDQHLAFRRAAMVHSADADRQSWRQVPQRLPVVCQCVRSGGRATRKNGAAESRRKPQQPGVFHAAIVRRDAREQSPATDTFLNCLSLRKIARNSATAQGRHRKPK
jgi:hypothetical protein